MNNATGSARLQYNSKTRKLDISPTEMKINGVQANDHIFNSADIRWDRDKLVTKATYERLKKDLEEGAFYPFIVEYFIGYYNSEENTLTLKSLDHEVRLRNNNIQAKCIIALTTILTIGIFYLAFTTPPSQFKQTSEVNQAR